MSPSIALVTVLSLGSGLLLLTLSQGGWLSAAALLVTAFALFGFGYAALWLLAKRIARTTTALYLAMPVGVIIFCGLAQVGNNLALPGVKWLFPLTFVLSVIGWILAIRLIRSIWSQPVSLGWWYVAVVALIGVMDIAPTVFTTYVVKSDGSVAWSYPDEFFHQAMAVELKSVLADVSPPPRTPGFCRQKLCYQYGRHALAAQVSYWLGVSAGDALLRDMPVLGIWGVIGLSVACARIIAARMGTSKSLAGLLALCLVFLLPSIEMVYANAVDTSLRHPFMIIPPHWSFIVFGRWEAATGAGGSATWACLISFAIALLLFDLSDAKSIELPWAAMVLSSLAIALNATSALCCWGTCALFLLTARWRRWTTYLFLICFASVFLATFFACGFDLSKSSQPRMGGIVEASASLYEQVFLFVSRLLNTASGGVFLFLGLRALAVMNFVWSDRGIRKALVCFAVAHLGAYLAIDLDAYPLAFLGSILSLFAAPPLCRCLTLGREACAEAKTHLLDLVRVYRRYFQILVPVVAVSLLPTIAVRVARHSFTNLPGSFKAGMFALLLAILGYVIFGMLNKTANRLSPRVFSPMLACVVVISFLGAIRPFALEAAGFVNSTVDLDAGRVASLSYLKITAPSDATLATTHHSVECSKLRERSLMYSVLTARRILLEGWRYATAQNSPEFATVRRDNEAIFSTEDESLAKKLVQQYGISHLLVEPEAKLHFNADSAAWLKPVANPGSLKIYVVIPDKLRQ